MAWRRAIAPAVASGLAAALALTLGRLPPERLPQRAQGEDALSVALGDARQTLARALVHKADSYFHGGVDFDHACLFRGDAHDEGHGHGGCGCACSGHGHEGAHTHHHAACSQGHDHGKQTAHEDEAPHADAPMLSFDPWAWINVHRAAPEIERHLEGKKAVELMPWLWASLKADPKNADTWTTAWYIADSVMGDKAYGLTILDEALRALPDNPEILFYRGQALYRRGQGDLPAARAAFEGACAALRRIEAQRPLTEHEHEIERIVSDYLYNMP